MFKRQEIADVVSSADFTYEGSKEKTFKFHSVQVDVDSDVLSGTFSVDVKIQGSDVWANHSTYDPSSDVAVFNIQGLFDEIRLVPNSIVGPTTYDVTIASST